MLSNLMQKKSKIKMWCAASAMLASSAFGVAQAAEITLFENNGYGGRSLTIRGHTPDLNNYGFNDRTRSFVVKSGNWQLCTQAQFSGTCINVGPGQYVDLDRRLADRLSSLREQGAYGANTEYSYGGYQRGAMELFERRGFNGRALTINRNESDFSNVGFNDRAQSLVVTEGVWELCQHSEYRGNCRRFAPGRYAELGFGMAGEISSARMITNLQNAPVVIESPRGSGESVTGSPTGRVVLFTEDNLRGQSMVVTDATIDLEPTGFNDRLRSFVIEEGYWEFCSDYQFRGNCEVIGPGQYRRATASQYRSLSSLRPVVQERRGPQRRANAAQVELFSGPDFTGDRYDTNTDVYNFEAIRFNDRASSLIIYSGSWEVCEDAEFRGECRVYGRGRYPSLFNMNNRISSLRKLN